jgi:hypothetical protein
MDRMMLYVSTDIMLAGSNEAILLTPVLMDSANAEVCRYSPMRKPTPDMSRSGALLQKSDESRA